MREHLNVDVSSQCSVIENLDKKWLSYGECQLLNLVGIADGHGAAVY
jgi:hypothetical protein